MGTETLECKLNKDRTELTVVVPLVKIEEAKLSSTGKSFVLGTSHGFKPVGDTGIMLSLTVIGKK